MSGPIFSVERRAYARDGTASGAASVTRDVVVHPGAVTVLPVLEDGWLVMIRNYRYATECELLELPAGTLEPDESPERCALREVEEETGYRAQRVEPLCEFYTTPGICTERMWAFVARGLTETRQNLQGDERIRVVVMPPDQLRRMLVAGEIEDGKTIAALGTYFLRDW